MIDKLTLSQNESVYLDTTNNTVTIILLDSATIEIRDEQNNLRGTLGDVLEMYTLSINTGVYTAINTSSSSARILIFRQFIY